MRLNKIEIAPNKFGPDIPKGLEFKSIVYRPETDDYWGEFAEGQNPNEITALQGEQYLDSIKINGQNGLEVVMGIVNSQSLIVQRFFAKSEVWRKDTEVLKAIADALGIDLDVMFAEAKKFDRYLK